METGKHGFTMHINAEPGLKHGGYLEGVALDTEPKPFNAQEATKNTLFSSGVVFERNPRTTQAAAETPNAANMTVSFSPK